MARCTLRSDSGRVKEVTMTLGKWAVCFALGAGLVLGACDQKKDRVAFDGVYFKAKQSKQKKGGKTFTVSVKPVSASFDGAREAGRYEGTKYCIQYYGTSEIDWIVGPDADLSQLIPVDDTLTLQGVCDP